MENGKKIIMLTHRGLATVLAVQEGVIPKCEGGYDNEAFERFWTRYEEESKKLSSDKNADDILKNKFCKRKKICFTAFGFSLGVLLGFVLASI